MGRFPFGTMRGQTSIPVALTIAGSDSGGGAGIQADLKTFAALGVHGTSAVTCLTAQNPKRILAVEPCRPGFLRRQLEAVFAELKPSAAKTGMLYSEAIIREIAAFLRRKPRIPLVVDPVMVSSSGRRLLQPAAIQALDAKLLPLAVLVTPNLAEAEILAGQPLRSPEDMRVAARRLHERFGCAVLVKGGHLQGCTEAVDILFDGRQEWLLRAPYVRGVKTHGTGCTYSAAITAYLARKCPLPQAVQEAKGYITRAIAGARRVGGHDVLA
jgi:hydroxymethylpyrimidine/phosphomethylpyrimidine kinase